MTPHLTDEQRKALAANASRPVFLRDPQTDTDYVLMPADTYLRVRSLIDDDTPADADEFMPLAHEAFGEAWDAPGMERYEDYDRNRRPLP